jgi:putative FmdB family regulatory protein
MPTYEYECSKCKRSFEIFQSMKDEALTTCPKELCRQKTWGKGKVSRLLGTGAGLIFKGSGFYITDYRSEGYKTAAKKETDSGKPAADTGGTKTTESKPASTTTAAPATPATPAPAPKKAASKGE